MTLRQVLRFLTIIVFLSCCGYNTNNNLDISKTKIESIQTESALDPYVIRTFVQMDPEQFGINLTESKECNLLTYYEMSDGTYMYQGKKYQYKIEKSGLINPTQGLPDELLYIILCNTENFELQTMDPELSSLLWISYIPNNIDGVIVGAKIPE